MFISKFQRKVSGQIPRVVTLLGASSVVVFTMASPVFAQNRQHSTVKKSGVSVLYAGSLVGTITKAIGPDFTKATNYPLNGLPGGSVALANEIKGNLQKADVFISASPSSDSALEGKANGNFVNWYFTLGKSPLVLGYNPSSKFAKLFKKEPWWKVLQTPGIQVGRTDPKLDPKGALTIALVKAEAKKIHDPALVNKILGSEENPNQVFPEETLVSRLTAGQLDVGFFFLNEARFAKIPTVASGINLAAQFTATIVKGAPNFSGAVAFIKFLYSSEAKRVFTSSGLDESKVRVYGDKGAVPKALRGLVGKG